jgi:flavin-dependent dehydrogenase
VLAQAGIDPRRLEAIGAVRIHGYRKFRDGAVTEEAIAPREGWAAHAYGVRRQKFDYLVWTEALAVGAEWAGGFRVDAVNVMPGRGVEVRGAIDRRPARAAGKLAIIASGAAAAYYRALGSQPQRATGAIAGGLRQYFAIQAPLSPTFDFYYISSLPGGYAWLFPVGEGLVNAGVWSRGDAGGHRRLRQAWREFLQMGPEALSGARPLGRPHGALLRPALSHKLADDYLLWVGDGAGLTHGETGQGISYALESGRRAAGVAGETLRANQFDNATLSVYDRWIRESFSHELRGWGRANCDSGAIEGK